MRFKLIEGVVRTITCLGCNMSIQAGTTPYQPANGSKQLSKPQRCYTEDVPNSCYCESCANKIVLGVDITRSFTSYYHDTR